MSIPTSTENAAEFNPTADNVFARIASRYDFLCDIFSLDIHRIWKNRMARYIAHLPGSLVLDAASGTGDIPLRALRSLDNAAETNHQKRFIVSDLCPEMLAIAQSKKRGNDARLEYQVLDAHGLVSIDSNSVDIFSISFAMKICDRKKVMTEAFRVLKPNGVFLCLEAARIPIKLVHAIYLRYMNFCLPFIARVATGGDASAYDYLLKGIHEFPTQTAFAEELKQQGFQNVEFENLTLGVVALHRGAKP